MVERIEARMQRLASGTFARRARLGRIAGTHELVEPPYVIVYRVFEKRNELHVLAIIHGARRRR